MTDSLLSRALLAIEESHSLREQRHVLKDQQGSALDELRYAIFASASTRMEIKARRDDKE